MKIGADWGPTEYAYYSYADVFTPDLVLNWYKWDWSGDWSEYPSIELEPIGTGFDIVSLDYDNTHISLTITKDASLNIVVGDTVYLNNAEFNYVTCNVGVLHVKFEETYSVVAINTNSADPTHYDVSLYHWKEAVDMMGLWDQVAPYQCGGLYVPGTGQLIVV